MKIIGIHHITLITADAQRATDFYTRVLGLRLVKKTVNFDDPGSYHLYFGDAEARPGTLVTFFEWPGAPKGLPGIGGTHHFALSTRSRDTLLQWKRRLTDLKIRVDGPYDRKYFTSIYFRDRDRQVVEIATLGPGFTIDEPPADLGAREHQPPQALTPAHRDAEAIAAEMWAEPVETVTPAMRLDRGLHHLSATTADLERTHAFYHGLLGMRRVKRLRNFDDPGMAHWFWGSDDGRPGTLVTYFEADPSRTRRARIGTGQTHHFALAVGSEDEQRAWRDHLLAAGLSVSEVRDRVYFKSIYTHDPDGHIVELATVGPGFTVDEPLAALGTRLALPPWLEAQRSAIESRLGPLDASSLTPAS